MFSRPANWKRKVTKRHVATKGSTKAKITVALSARICRRLASERGTSGNM